MLGIIGRHCMFGHFGSGWPRDHATDRSGGHQFVTRSAGRHQDTDTAGPAQRRVGLHTLLQPVVDPAPGPQPDHVDGIGKQNRQRVAIERMTSHRHVPDVVAR